MEWSLNIILILLLAATLFHALRLERALGVLKRDRAELEELIAGFNSSTVQAEQGIDRLRQAADGTGRQIARQIEAATGLKDDLLFLSERGDRIADRLDGLVRKGAEIAPDPSISLESFLHNTASFPTEITPRTQLGERDRMAAAGVLDEETTPRLRSQAERDLLKALRMAR